VHSNRVLKLVLEVVQTCSAASIPRFCLDSVSPSVSPIWERRRISAIATVEFNKLDRGVLEATCLKQKNAPEPRLIGQRHVFEEGDVGVVVR
jgi:hypothetical protein